MCECIFLPCTHSRNASSLWCAFACAHHVLDYVRAKHACARTNAHTDKERLLTMRVLATTTLSVYLSCESLGDDYQTSDSAETIPNWMHVCGSDTLTFNGQIDTYKHINIYFRVWLHDVFPFDDLPLVQRSRFAIARTYEHIQYNCFFILFIWKKKKVFFSDVGQQFVFSVQADRFKGRISYKPASKNTLIPPTLPKHYNKIINWKKASKLWRITFSQKWPKRRDQWRKMHVVRKQNIRVQILSTRFRTFRCNVIRNRVLLQVQTSSLDNYISVDALLHSSIHSVIKSGCFENGR